LVCSIKNKLGLVLKIIGRNKNKINYFYSSFSYTKKQMEMKNYRLIYIPVSIVLICISPMLFVLFNTLSIGFLLYFRINLRDLFQINIFFLLVWFSLYSCYAYLLVHEPTIPINSGNSFILNPENLVLIIGYTVKFPSICRGTFVETIVILHVLHLVLGFYPTIYFF